ncbi:uncharacterized protein IWZ02DRAFT_459910 [Phyllosticta citriasiana]|uniref:uncharacterized protein n=1 Tax=Phyllosticta citriasiana TaxID=595635 RepID=UPI0030FD4FEE
MMMPCCAIPMSVISCLLSLPHMHAHVASALANGKRRKEGNLPLYDVGHRSPITNLTYQPNNDDNDRPNDSSHVTE